MASKRAIVIVLDGCGAGETPDSAEFGDLDHPATVRHVWERAGGLHAPHLERMGFFNACGVKEASPDSEAIYGRLLPLSRGKDSVTGHWEMMGIITRVPFPTYPEGFPAELIAAFEQAIGKKVIGNVPASGTEIIARLGEEHLRTGYPIVYTSADSVFQVAAHVDKVAVEQLFEWCLIARKLCTGRDNVQRVIARSFFGEPGAFERGVRKDFPLEPPPNLCDAIGDVLGVGVIPELFSGRGFRPSVRTANNQQHGVALLEGLESDARFIFANFEDFDMLYGHRNDPTGFGQALEAFDRYFGDLLPRLGPDDLLILTADHGNDPTSPSTDHSREFVPMVMNRRNETFDQPFNDVTGMAKVGEAVARHLAVDWDPK